MGKAAVPHPESLFSRGRARVVVADKARLKAERVAAGKVAEIASGVGAVGFGPDLRVV